MPPGPFSVSNICSNDSCPRQLRPHRAFSPKNAVLTDLLHRCIVTAPMNIPRALESTTVNELSLPENSTANPVESAVKISATASFLTQYVFGGAPLREFHDQEWFPQLLRDYVTDGLQFILNFARIYRPIVPRLNDAIRAAKPPALVDLCSGGGGPWPWLRGLVKNSGGLPIDVCLTDRFPNIPAFARLRVQSGGQINFYPEAVNAESPPSELLGFRTIFTSFHHFQPRQAQAILQQVVNARQGIAVFEPAQRRASTILSTVFMLLGGLAAAPFIQPFRFSRLFWSYVIPVIPMVLFYDGIVSCLRAYSEQEMAALVSKLDAEDYVWEIGKQSGWPAPVIYLVGYPRT